MDPPQGAVPKRSYGITTSKRRVTSTSSTETTTSAQLPSSAAIPPPISPNSVKNAYSNTTVPLQLPPPPPIVSSTSANPLKSSGGPRSSNSSKDESTGSWWEKMRVKTLNRRVAGKEGSIFETFLIAGLQPDVDALSPPLVPGETRSFSPQIIYQYPMDTKTDVSNVSHFCFPHGVPVRSLARTKSNSSLQELMFSSLQRIEAADHSFVFLLSTGETFLYGVCVCKDELVEDSPTLFNKRFSSSTVSVNHVNRSKSTSSPAAPRCYVVLSKFPYFAVHFHFLYTFLGRDHLIRINREMSDETQSLSSSQSLLSSSPSSTSYDQELKQLLSYYRSLQVPLNSRLLVELPNEKAYPFLCSVNEDDIIADVCFAALLRVVKPEQLIKLFTGLLLERHIVIVCKHAGLLSAVAFALIPLMHPFAWQGPFIPVLPQIMHDCIEAPVPCVLGVLHLASEEKSNLKDALVLELDGETSLSSPSLPFLPQQSTLLERILSRYEHASVALGPNHRAKSCPFKPTSELQRIGKEVLDDLRVWNTWLIEGLTQLMPEDSTFDLSESKSQYILVEGTALEHQDFVTQLLSAQHFMVYMELHLKQKKNTVANALRTRSISTPKVISPHNRTVSGNTAPGSSRDGASSSSSSGAPSPLSSSHSNISVLTAKDAGSCSPPSSASPLATLLPASNSSGSFRKAGGAMSYYQSRISITVDTDAQQRNRVVDTSIYGRL